VPKTKKYEDKMDPMGSSMSGNARKRVTGTSAAAAAKEQKMARAKANKGMFGGGTLIVPKSKPASKPSMPDRKPVAGVKKGPGTKAVKAKPPSQPKSGKQKGGFDFGSAIARGMGGSSAWDREKRKAGVRD
jgi:hypothetical protein